MGVLNPNPAKERLAGFITIASILIGTLVLIMIMQLDWNKYQQYRLTFSLLQDASGIQVGTPVNVGGITYGRVTRVDSGPLLDVSGNLVINPPIGTSPATAMLGTFVTFQLDSTISLWPSARINRNASVLGGNVSIEIFDTGFENQADPQFESTISPLITNSTIRASNPPSGVSNIFGGAVAMQLDNFYQDFTVFQDWIALEFKKMMTTEFQNIQTSVNSLRVKVNSDIDQWSSRIKSMKANTAEMNRRLGIAYEGEQDQKSFSAVFNNLWPQIQADAQNAKDNYNLIATEFKNTLSNELIKVYQDYQKQFTLLNADLETLGVASKENYAVYALSLAELSLSGGQISRTFENILSELIDAVLDSPNDEEFLRQDQLMIARELAVHAQEVQFALQDVEAVVSQMKTSAPVMMDELRQRTIQTLAELKKALDSFHATLRSQSTK